MRWAVVVVLFAALYAAAAPVRIEIPAPGSKGMVSAVDKADLPKEAAVILTNADVTTRPGKLLPRYGLKGIGDSAVAKLRWVYEAVPFMDPYSRLKQVVSVTYPRPEDTVMLHWIRTGAHAWGDAAWFIQNGNGTVELQVSDTFGYYPNSFCDAPPVMPVGDSSGSPLDKPLLASGVDHALTPISYGVVATDGTNPPLVYSGLGTITAVDTLRDTVAYQPHATTLDLEAPGQLRVTVINQTQTYPLRGYYQWAYGYGKAGQLSIPSRVTWCDGHKVLLRGFLHEPIPYDSLVGVAADSSELTGYPPTREVYLYRRHIYNGQPQSWVMVDSITQPPLQDIGYMDNGSDLGFVATPTGGVAPGALRWSRDAHGGVTYILDTSVYKDSLYAIRYSWYDPVLDLESPMGPLITTKLVSTYAGIGDDTLQSRSFTIGRLNSKPPAPYFRVYQTVVQTGLPGAGDTNVFYCLGQFRAVNNETYGPEVKLGYAPDTAVANGFLNSQYNAFYYDWQNVLESDGGPVVRPPYVGGCPFGFTQVLPYGQRLFGIGNREYPQRLYFSGFAQLNTWLPQAYLSIDEFDQDRLTALAELPGRAGMVAFKQGKTYLVTGNDPDYDLSYSLVSDHIGTLSPHTVTRLGQALYFLASDLMVYRLGQGGPEPVGQPIRDSLASHYGNSASYAEGAAKLLTFDNSLLVVDTGGAGFCYQFTPESGTWQILTYPIRPIATFRYDTLPNGNTFDYSGEWIASGKAFPWATRTLGREVDSVSFVGVDSTPIDIQYRSTPVGDGQSLWCIREVEFRCADTARTITVAVYNEEDSLLTSTTLTPNATQLARHYKVGLSRHVGRFLTVQLSTNGGRQTNVAIDDVAIIAEKVGADAIR